MTGVHQFCKIGSYAMTSGCSLVLKDIPAYVMVSGNPAQARSMNFEGMKRRGWSKQTIASLRTAYKVLYRQGLTLEQALAEMEAMEASDELQLLIDSLKASERGITR
ncbi:MAG: UDP-N-acetylglucosamine acyltransferase [Alcanivorax sp.]|jgi:UDP-N-acetylglucosamine acyltransferase